MIKLIPYNENLCSKDATKMLSIKINDSCNCKCEFCVDRGGRKTKFVDIQKIADAAINYTDYKTVIVTGGEPFLIFNDVVKLLTLLKPYKERIVLNTNGTLLNVEKVEKLNNLIDELQVSIHHYDELKHNQILNNIVSFDNIKKSLENKKFIFSINSTFNNSYSLDERLIAVDKMIELAVYLNADKVRLTELKKVDNEKFISADNFFKNESEILKYSSNELITKGCTYYYSKNNIDVSVKRLCKYAKGKNAPAFSCCFINTNGQHKIDVETKDTFKVIYSDGLVTDDWIFDQKI